MSLNIKNKEAHKLASQPAKLTGESLTEAVTKADFALSASLGLRVVLSGLARIAPYT